MKDWINRTRISKFNKFLFPVTGILAIVWFLIRVIPKPSRAAYPCMRVAYPLASTFILYLLGLATSALALDRMKMYWTNSRIWAAGFFVVALVAGFLAFQADQPPVFANSSYLDTANAPIGVARGIFPGRVVWDRNPDATNENCRNRSFGDAYYLPQNTNMTVVDGMVRESLLKLTGTSKVRDAWDSLFVYFNSRKGKGAIGYRSGEKIFIKTNGIGSTVVDSSNHSITDITSYIEARTSPQPVLALLRGLINDYGIPQENISVGDPQRDVQNEYWDIWHTEFPNVKYICNKGGQGRTLAVKGTRPSVFFSDKGAVLRSGSWSDMSVGNPVYQDTLYKVIEDADYMIYVGDLKVHERAGMTVIGKLNFGSQIRQNAMHMHMGLVNPDGFSPAGNKNSRFGYRQYRVLVDLMGHNKLGGNTVLFVVDALWGGRGANLEPVKFKMAPFNNDWPSSIFMSQDPIALESVCYDLLKAEFTSDKHAETYPQMVGVDDHLHQAADSANWPTGVRYDPENDGTPIGSLGVHEHWNNTTDMQYSRNLGKGNGIELLKLNAVASAAKEEIAPPGGYALEQNYPNPFNPSTTINYSLPKSATVTIKIFNALGQEVALLVNERKDPGNYQTTWNAANTPSGEYFYRLQAGEYTETKKMILLR
ncbi:MAG: T9SS type A sorting domain-containing protein [Bacteroidota bacterium]